MKRVSLGRSLTPLGWVAVAVIALALMLLVTRGLGLSWDPLGLGARRLAQAEQAARRGQAEALARQLEAASHSEQQRRQEAASAQLKTVAETTAKIRIEARRADDATTPLDQARLGRLRDHDRQLCAHAQPLAGCATKAEPARTG